MYRNWMGILCTGLYWMPDLEARLMADVGWVVGGKGRP